MTELLSQAINWAKLIVGKLAEVLFKLAEFIASQIGYDSRIVYIVLLVALSLFIASKLTYNRGIEMILISGVLAASFWWLNGAR